MVVGVEVSRREGIGTRAVLGSASLVGLHILCIPVLGTALGIVIETIWWHVWHDIGIMDDSVDWHLRSEVGCKCSIADSWLTVGIELAQLSKGSLDIEGCEGSESASETVPCHVDRRSAVFVQNQLHLCLDNSRDFSIAFVEPLVNETPAALGVGVLLKVNIRQPILDVDATSKSSDDCVVGRAIADKALDV